MLDADVFSAQRENDFLLPSGVSSTETRNREALGSGCNEARNLAVVSAPVVINSSSSPNATFAG
jgi:hypothetical protein